MMQAQFEMICNSCKRRVANDSGAVSFTCPNCQKAQITRCVHCRKLASKYRCLNCGFMGPN